MALIENPILNSPFREPARHFKNEKGAVIYYLYPASPNSTGARIVSDIFDTHRMRGAH